MSIHVLTGKRGVRYQVRYRRADGSQGGRTFRRRHDAERFQAEVVLDGTDLWGLSRKERKKTFGEVAQRWCQLQSKDHKPRTVKRRNEILRKHLLPEIGHMPIRAIKNSHLQDLKISLENKQLAPLTIRNIFAIAKPIFGLAIQEELIATNPTKGVKLSNKPQKTGRALEPEECRTLLANLDDHHRRIFYVLLATGLRIGELLDLTVGDLDLQKRSLTVATSKTNSGKREIYLGDHDIAVLREHLRTLGENRHNQGTWLFQSTHGKRLQYRNLVQRVLQPVIKQQGMKPFTLHDLRRTHATMLVAAGNDPKTVQERMGHVDIETTLKYYAKSTEEGKRRAAGAIVQFLAGDETPSSTRQTFDMGVSLATAP